MWLVICGEQDAPARWAYRGLRAAGLQPLELLTTESLGTALWEHRVGSNGAAVRITLADGRQIDSRAVRGALNRAMSVPPASVLVARPDQRDYVSMELFAFYLSWLNSLPGPVLNRPTPQGLSGAWRHASEWAWLAARAGLPAPPYHEASSATLEDAAPGDLLPASVPRRQVIVAGEHVLGPSVPPAIQAGCRALAHLAETALLGIQFAETPAGPWSFCGATPWPDLSAAGESVLDALAEVLRNGEEVEP